MDIILGAVVSAIVQIIKKFGRENEWITLAIVVVLSVLASIFYSLFSEYGLWDKIIPILMTAGAIYAFIIRRFDK